MKLVLTLILLFVSIDLVGQVRPRPKERKVNSLIEQGGGEITSQTSEIRSVFRRIEKGLLDGAVADIADEFADQVAVQMSGVEAGTYSSIQAGALLQSFLSSRKPASFSFSRTSETSPIVFATGRLYYVHRGSKESVQVYVSLAQQNGRWVIVQFNMY